MTEVVVNETAVRDAEVVDAEVIDAQAAAPRGSACLACGGPVESLDKFCPACGADGPSAASSVTEAAETERKHYRCRNCGSEVALSAEQRSYTCAFCDSTFVVEFSPDETGRRAPEFIIGFAVTREVAQAKFRAWLGRNAWYRPSDLTSAAAVEKLRGVYLPFWSFSMLAQSEWSANIGEYWYRTETYTTTNSKGRTVTRTRRVRMTEWWPLSGRHHRYYSGHLVSGSSSLPQAEARRVKPFNLPALKRYEPYYLAGWLCEEYNVGREKALSVCQQEFYRRESTNVAAFLPGDTQRGLHVSTDFEHVNADLCLLPVYLFTFRYKDKPYRFLVNGQTGKTAGDKPVSWARIWTAIGIGVAIVAGVVLGGVLVNALSS